MKVEFTEQELAVIAYGLEDHITTLNKEINYLDELVGTAFKPGAELRRAHSAARRETQTILDKVERLLHNA